MKNKLIIFLLLFFILFRCLPVHAETIDSSKYIYRNVEIVKEKNETGEDIEYIKYRVYTTVGKLEGKIKKPDDTNFFIAYDDNSGKLYSVSSKYSTTTYRVLLLWSNVSGKFDFDILGSSAFSYSEYNFETNEWGSKSNVSTNGKLYGVFRPNGIIYNTGHKIVYDDNKSHTVDYQYIQDNQVLEYPHFDYIVTDGFKVQLRDYYTHNTDSNLDPWYKYTLNSFKLSAFNYDTQDYLLKDINILSYSTIQEDNSLDILFSDILKPLYDNGGDFLLTFTINLNSTLYDSKVDGFNEISNFRFKTNYQTILYSRFKFDRFTKVGTFNPSDSEGNPIEGGNNTPDTPEDKVSSSINNQTQKIEEQTNAINNQTQKIEDQTNAIKEGNETNKNIFQKIGDILNFINPLSKDFFVYKLIELLIDAIKGLFIPSDDFLGNFFSELYNWFCDRLGFLSYPLQLIINILNKILNINFAEPVIHIPNIHEPFTNELIIAENNFNFNSLLSNNILKNVHDIYLILVDAVIIFAIVNLAKHKLEEVTKS